MAHSGSIGANVSVATAPHLGRGNLPRYGLAAPIALLLCASLPGCDGVRDAFKEVGPLAGSAMIAAEGESSPTVTDNVIPSRAPSRLLEVRIEAERSMARLARHLGTTVDAILSDNAMTSTALTAGMVLKVHTSPGLLAAFEENRRARKARAAQRVRDAAAAKLQAKQQRELERKQLAERKSTLRKAKRADQMRIRKAALRRAKARRAAVTDRAKRKRRSGTK